MIPSSVKGNNMKKAIYIWILCLGGLFLSQQTMAQRGHGTREHNNNKSYKQSQRNRRQQVKAYKQNNRAHYNNRNNYSRNDRRVFAPNRGHYNNRPQPVYRGRRIARAPVGHGVFRPAPWAARHHYGYDRHVYFPDYHAFYDARRHGYVYRHGGRWIFSQALPSFMVGLNWNNVRLQYLQGVPMTAYPQDYYDTYVNRYPALSFNLNVNL
ncbi:hypothetical protein SAMN05192529_102293 [Arachidicoccus rhizosphaerae]|uniref:Uncharacterized protein n=2 Tax=Arachidicoccus rhizosphaerae TaxID=551991 RepID=A0A1H3WDM4_9BACT|nr:hypothetical protein SAMN05192529_102293 [Arachidicoccus rhizosphaerae]